jgi:hypothetical protein
MQPYPYSPSDIQVLRSAISTARFQTYLDRAGGHDEMALRHYVWNSSVASAFQAPLQTLEVTLRNAVHERMKHTQGASWFDLPNVLKSPETSMIAEAKKFLTDRGEATNPNKVLAELSFRFWVGLFSRKYDRLWVSQLQAAFSPRPIRQDLHVKLDRLRTLRNRIAHHEPILHRDLMADLADIKEIVGALSPTVLDWLNWHEQATIRFATPIGDIDLF